MRLRSPKYSSLSSYVKVAVCEENIAVLKDYFPHVSRFFHFFASVYSNLLRRMSLLKAVSPCCPQVFPYVHLPIHSCTLRATRCPENKRACEVSTWILITRRKCPVKAFRLAYSFRRKRNESWIGCGNTVHFARSHTFTRKLCIGQNFIKGCFRLILYPGVMW